MTKFLELDIRIRVRCIIIVTIMQFLNWPIHGAAVNLNPVCTTQECQKLGKMLLDSMNKNVSACSNFYDYVCGRWPIQNPRPKSYDEWSNFDISELEELKQLKKLLESTDKSTPDNEAVKELYKACMKLPYLEKSPPNVITKIMTIVGHWPIFLPTNKEITAPWSIIDNEYIKRTGESAIFDLSVVQSSSKEKNYMLLQLKPLFSPYGTIVRPIDWGMLSTEKKNYKRSLYKIIEAVAPVNISYFINNIDKDLTDVINFREDLRQMIDKLPERNAESFTIKQFQELYNNEALRDDTAKIDWSQKLNDIYKNLTDSPFYDAADTMVYADTAYFLKLAHLLRKTTKRVIANHIHLYFAERHLTLSSDVQHEIRRSFSNSDHTNGRIRHDRPRWKWCLEQHNLQTTMRKMYIEAFFPITRRAEIEKLFVDTKNLVKQQIAESSWLGNTSVAEKSIEKINNMTSVIGYPVTASFDVHSKIAFDPLKTEIYYLRKENAVCATAVSLQAPLYGLNVPYVIQYGATVATFGHEVYHVFHRNALKYDCYGKKWWPSAMRKKFEEQLKCFKNQYREKRSRELYKHGIVEWDLLLDSSSEDVSDIMGIKAAYKGYKQMLEKSKNICQVLPGFENTSCDQLFFIAFAHSLCSDYSDAGKKQQLLTDVHSFPSIRVNGIALNMEEFDTAFGCQPADSTRNAKRCDIWKN